MITKIDEYNMYNQRGRHIRIELENLNKVFKNEPCKFVIKTRFSRTWRDFQYNEVIHNIEYDNRNYQFKINFKKDDTYITVKNRDVFFHERYESLHKRILNYDETLTEIITMLQKL